MRTFLRVLFVFWLYSILGIFLTLVFYLSDIRKLKENKLCMSGEAWQTKREKHEEAISSIARTEHSCVRIRE
jgi:hypothetical protein